MTRARDLADFNFDGKAVTINESSADLDFRVESNGNANMLTVNAGDDRVGIGCDPERDLHVKGASGDPVHFKLEGDASDYARIMFDDGTDDNIGEIRYDFSSDSLQFTTNASECFRILSDGKVGIGTSIPDSKLTLASSSSGEFNAISIRQANNTSGNESRITFTRTTDAGSDREVVAIVADRVGGNDTDLVFETNTDGSDGSTERFRIDHQGRVSIHPDGTAFFGESSADNFNIYQTGANVGMTLRSDTDRAIGIYFADGASGGDLYRGYIQYNHANELFDFAGQGAVRLIAGGNEKVRVLTNSTPHVLVGCTSAPSSSVAGTAISTTDAGSLQSFSGTTSASTHAAFGNTNGVVGSIQTTNSTTAFNTSSDRRLKSNIQDSASASDKIDAIQVRQFDWKADDIHQDYGLIAQELQPIEPMAVTGDADSDEMMSVDYSKLVPMLLKEIQELRSRVATLEAS